MQTCIKRIEIFENNQILLSISSYKSQFSNKIAHEEVKKDNLTYKYEICDQGCSDISFCADTEVVPIKLYENSKYWFEFFNIDTEINKKLLKILLTDINTSENNQTIKGNYLSDNYVGILNLDIFNIVSNHIEVESRKINYKDEFSKLVEELTEDAIDLISRDSSFHQNMISKSSKINDKKENLYSSFSYIKSFLTFDKMPLYLSYLIGKPHTTVYEQNEQNYIWEIDDFEVDDLMNAYEDESNIFEADNVVSSLITNRFPLNINGKNFYDTADNFENQFIKHVLELIYDYLHNINSKDLGEKFKWEIEQCELIVGQYLDTAFFKDISRLKKVTLNSKVLQRKYPYDKFLKFFFSWDMSSSVFFDMFDEAFCMGQKDVPTMYEYFSFIKFIKEFDKKGYERTGLLENGLFKYQRETFNFTLKSGKTSLIKYKIKDEYFLKLYYNKEYNSTKYIVSGRSYSNKLIPDISLELFHNKNLIGIVHFDAKYKVGKMASFKKEDINKMHTYKDAIMGTLASYILYPGKKPKVFVQEELQYSENVISLPSVGACPLSIDGDITNEMQYIFRVIEKFIELSNDDREGRFKIPPKPYNGVGRIID